MIRILSSWALLTFSSAAPVPTSQSAFDVSWTAPSATAAHFADGQPLGNGATVVLAWADTLGAAEILRRLKPLADLGVRMHPTASLVEMARTGSQFTACHHPE